MYRERLRRVREYMQVEKLEQIIISSPASIYYLSGIWVEPHERMLALYLDSGNEMTLFGNEIFGLTPSPELPLINHKDGDNPVLSLSQKVKPGRIGIDKFWYSKFLIGLLQLRDDLLPVHGSAPVDLARKNKDKAEIEKMRRSSAINDLVVGSVISAVREGVAENELASLVNKIFLANGADCEGTQLVCFGANGADPHHAGDATILKPGDSIIFDIFTPIDRYWCDMTRTVFYKDASDRQREVYNLVKTANESAIAVVRPGKKISEIDGIAREIINEGGFGEFFTHRLGHGIGLECHEPPDVSGVTEDLLEEGMIFSVEPGIYLPGEFGVRIEDLVLVTKDGCEVLNKYPKDLKIVE